MEGRFQVANEGSEKFKIRWDHIKLLRDSTGQETYAFGIEDVDNDPKTFYNLIFKLTAEGTPYQPYLMKYSMTEAFAEQFYATGSLDGFSGSIQKIIIKDLYSAFPSLMVTPDTEEQMVGEPCPSNTQMEGGSSSGSSSTGGTGTSGSGSTDTGSSEDQGSGFTMNTRCEGYVQATDWFHCFDASCSNKIYSHTTYEYSTVCSTSYTLTSAAGTEDDACTKETEDTPIILPDLLDCSTYSALGISCTDLSFLAQLSKIELESLILSESDPHKKASYQLIYLVSHGEPEQIALAQLFFELKVILDTDPNVSLDSDYQFLWSAIDQLYNQVKSEMFLAVFNPETVITILSIGFYTNDLSSVSKNSFFNTVARYIAKNAGRGYSTFEAFKRAEGVAGNGRAWHHIVSQRDINVAKFGAQRIHNTNNIVNLPHGSGTWHNRITGFFNTKNPLSPIGRINTNDMTFGQWVAQKSFQEQYEWGLKVMNWMK